MNATFCIDMSEATYSLNEFANKMIDTFVPAGETIKISVQFAS
jgi:hypothetical protein